MYYNTLSLEETKRTSQLKVALVDDQILLRDGLAGVVDGFNGYKVVLKAANGMEFIEGLKASLLPDIVILDINMPVMDGYETARWLSENHPGIFILLLTMFDSELMLTRLIQLGVKAFLKKDAYPSELLYALDALMKDGYYYPQAISGKLANIFQNASTGKASKKTVTFSDNEIRFLKWAGSDLTYKEIAEKMCISERTVENYRASLCEKLSLKNRMDLAMFAIKNGIIHF